uniref:mannose-1-phosphate guanylyltransferase n=1 Tax=Geoglobus ahangari TaxID=113653 RepID=A0A7C3YNS1_9EURY
MKTIILAGGSGTRLWPLSREYCPKQFIKFDETSLFQKAVKRSLIFSKPDEIFIVTNERYKFLTRDQLREIGVDLPEENILIEPEAKNTLPAVCYGVKVIVEKSGNETIAVLPSDHLIEANKSYINAFRNAEKLAENYLVTFGIKPTHPHTGYGYIKPGKKLEYGYLVEAFTEKPDYDTAKKFVNEGYYWNSGIFMFKAEVFFEECMKYQPEILKIFEIEDIKEAYKKLPEISIDYGIMEKTSRAAVVPLNTMWSDVGSFDALYSVSEKDANGNTLKGDCLVLDSKNNLIFSEKLVAAIDLEGIVIVDTRDAVLVCPRKSAQKVRKIVEMLKSRRDKRAEFHRTVYHPWGSLTILEENNFYKIYRRTILPKKKLPLQRHYHRSEHWIVVKGTAKVTVDGKEFLLRNGESTFVPAGKFHQIENPGSIPLEVIEVQIGEYLGEDDVEILS